jgi:DNA-directed RNA polymerase subunit RPC12/RpoP
MSNKQTGDFGEKEVIELIKCPNCGNKLVLLPPGFPLYDVQCSRCMFRAQIKTNNSRPKNTIFGAGWDIYNKVLKAGYLAPPLIINFKWQDKKGRHQEIRFYPFIARRNIKKYTLAPTARRANYKMFRYDLGYDTPYFMLRDTFYPSDEFQKTLRKESKRMS